MGDFIFTKWFGKTHCAHYDRPFPNGTERDKVILEGGKVYGPVVGFGIFGKYCTVEIPFYKVWAEVG